MNGRTARLLAAGATGAVTMSLAAVPAAGMTTRGTSAPASVTTAIQASEVSTDYCIDQCRDILPPGENGQATFTDLLAFESFGIRPKHSSDQRVPYESLVWNYSGLTNEQLTRFFNDASFGVPADQVESSVSPRSDVTIVRDKATGVPHITGTTRAGTVFGAGYAGAADRLFLMDALRHVSRGKLTSFAGGAQGNQEFEQQQWRMAPYTEADLQTQFDRMDDQYGQDGVQAQADLQAYVDGVNAYIAQARSAGTLPGEYTAIGHSEGPDPWRTTDVVATMGLIGGIFGSGGGGEVASALALVEAQARYGVEQGTAVWAAFRSQNDPETSTTVHGTSFPYGDSPADPTGRALPDRGSVATQPVVVDPSGSGGAVVATSSPPTPGMSNALLVSGEASESGHPIAVFGPQTGYFAPQLLMLQELEGPGIHARGASFAGTNLYVQMGRGPDYAWSATSAGQDITDTYAVELCEPSGAAPTLESMHYRFRGECLPIEVLEQHNSWSPTMADDTPAGSYTLQAQRTELGIVSHRGTVDGTPVAFTRLRSTYMRETGSAIGFMRFNEPGQIASAADFTRAAADVGYTFNWFYADTDQIAYVNSGDNPVRAAGADPNLPTWGLPEYEWADWDPATDRARYTPPAQHPQVVDQTYLTSWNNKPAPAYGAADGNYSFGPVHRSQPLDERIEPVLGRGEKFSRAELVQAMEDAATVDLRGDQVLPLLLRVLESRPVTDPALAQAVADLSAWQESGAQRRASQDPNQTGDYHYDHERAVQIMDAWWPLLVEAMFAADLGTDLYGRLTDVMPIDERPSPQGSAFQHGWWGYVHKDLRQVLGDPVADPFPSTFCGDGSLSACRTTLLDTLQQAVNTPATATYPATDACAAGDQFCADQIIHQPIGGITQPKMEWVNRPTYQQVVEFPARRGDVVGNVALNKTATASSYERGWYNLPPQNAVDGRMNTRWASDWSDPQWIRVDLGSSQQVARVVLRWEAAYGKGYRIEVSDDGQSWRSVSSTTSGDGGTDVVTFAPTTARYVRMYGTQRGTSYGYSLWELEVYQH